MKILTTLAFLLAASQAAAFDLPAVNIAALRAAPAAAVPAATPAKQAYTGALPTGDLFGPLPPYFHGQIGPMIRNGYPVPGVLEYFSSIIFYTDKAEALAAARGAAARIQAAGRTVVSVTAEEDRGVYTASVGFSGKTGVLYRWTDELPTYEEAAAVVARKTARYESEGYSVMETRINKLGPKYAIFIICAKFI